MANFQLQITEGCDTYDLTLVSPRNARCLEQLEVLESSRMPMGIQRVSYWMKNVDIAIISAYRGNLPKKENQERNKKLLSKLQEYGFGMFSVKGVYHEAGMDKPSSEHSFFLTNLNNSRNFKENLFKLAESFDQDSFLFKLTSENSAFLYGTSPAFENGYKGLIELGTLRIVVDQEEADSLSYKTIVKNTTYAFGY